MFKPKLIFFTKPGLKYRTKVTLTSSNLILKRQIMLKTCNICYQNSSYKRLVCVVFKICVI